MDKLRLPRALLSIFVMLLSLSHVVNSYKILILIPYSTQSHRNCFLPLALALAEKGDKITILSSLPPKKIHMGIKELNHGIVTDEHVNHTMFDQRAGGIGGQIAFFEEDLPRVARLMYNTTIVQELYRNRTDYDLIIIDELFNEMAFPFVEGGIPFIMIAPSGINIMSSSHMGNPLNPAYVPFPMLQYTLPMSMWQRWKNLFYDVAVGLYWKHIRVVPKVQEAVREYFPHLPSLFELEKNVSLILSNSHFTVNDVIPLLPNQVEVGGMHCRPAEKLPKDLKDFLDNADVGVVYFSLGSIAKGNSTPAAYRRELIDGFSKLKQKVLWKYEEDIPDLPSNILIKSWLPQQDVLAHPNVKIFITHCGLLSTLESIYHATPFLSLPIFGDQPSNAFNIQNKGLGLTIQWEELTSDLLVQNIEEVINNPIYQERMNDISTAFRDQPMSPLDTAVYWTEYVIRTKGAPHTKSHARNIGWIAYLYLDLLVFIHLVLYLFYKCFTFLWCKVLGNKTSSVDKNIRKKNKTE